jgi:hypothetical protein
MAGNARSWGPGTSAIVRSLVAASAPLTQVELAGLVGVSQPRVSQVLRRLADASAITSTTDGYVGRRARLIDLYVARHRPALAGVDVPWYSLVPMSEQVMRLYDHGVAAATRVAVSADLAPDLLASWRHPTLTVVYAANALDLTTAGFVRADGRVDATVLLRHIKDSTLLAAFEPWPRQRDGLPLADPLQQIWDLHDLGGADRSEAADRLRQAIISGSLGAPA